MSADSDVLAPVAYLAVAFPDGRITGEGFSLVDALVRAGTIAVLDIEFVGKQSDGTVAVVPLDQVEHGSEVDLASWRGSYSGLLDRADLDAVTAQLPPGGLVGVLVYENIWATPLIEAVDRAGAVVVGSGSIDTDDLVQALSATGGE